MMQFKLGFGIFRKFVKYLLEIYNSQIAEILNNLRIDKIQISMIWNSRMVNLEHFSNLPAKNLSINNKFLTIPEPQL